MKTQIILKQGDISEMQVDVIVNSANTELLLGSGVAGAIRRVGGPAIQEECNKIGMIPLGEAAVTGAGNLKAKYIIHAASMSLGTWATAHSIRQTVRNTLKRAEERKVKTMAFPAIGTGVGGFSIDRSAEAMFQEVLRHCSQGGTSLETVYFVLFDERSYKAFEEKYKEIVEPQQAKGASVPSPPQAQKPFEQTK